MMEIINQILSLFKCSNIVVYFVAIAEMLRTRE